MIELSVFAPDRTLVQKEQVTAVRLTTTEGQIEILTDHEKMVGVLRPGLFEFENGEHTVLRGFISNGYFEVGNNKCVVLAETLEKEAEIDLERALRAQKKAEALFAANTNDEEMRWTAEHFEKTSRKFERSLARQAVAGKKGDRKSTAH